MADETGEIKVETAENTSKASNLKLIIAGIVIIILAAGISFGVAMFAAKSFSQGGETKAEENKGAQESLGTTYDAGEFITNLAGESGSNFIKVKIVLAFKDAKIQAEIEDKFPQIQHVINNTLRQQSPEELSQPKAMEKLAELLRKNINSLLIKGNINSVYFTSFVVQ
ncbi:MAG: hypothetical protein CVU89_11955 [Firmicutes bacterium HGW-Firmicutes-14]|jgi:flagellar FliL protein|nr:MAG: hypothetical protein CVU89_11955 [Firmicutes bacterium HGW-Firmicutes-14]